MVNNVLIAGAGQLGSRYLQGLSCYVSPIKIWVFDIAPSALERAQHRWEECGGSAHSVVYVSDIADIPDKLDFVFVTSNSDVRQDIVRKIVQVSSVRFWILEKVLARRVSELYNLLNLTSESAGVWVNTPMYLWPLYKNIRDYYPLGTLLHARFSNINGLACNAIHYIDFVSRWNQGRIVSLDTSGLNNKWVSSKRAGFFEVEGQIAVGFSDGSTLLLSGSTKPEAYSVEFEIDGDIWTVDDVNGVAKNNTGRVITGSILRQSELIAPLLGNIVSSGCCGLPTLELSVIQHEPLLNALLTHWNVNMEEKLDYVPIT
jgi:hypothetical protein